MVRPSLGSHVHARRALRAAAAEDSQKPAVRPKSAGINDKCYNGGDAGHQIAERDARRAQANCMAIFRADPRCTPPHVPVPVPVTDKQTDRTKDKDFLKKMEELTGLTGVALILYLIVFEGSRLFPPRNLIPVPSDGAWVARGHPAHRRGL
jgi:hypothetical protein